MHDALFGGLHRTFFDHPGTLQLVTRLDGTIVRASATWSEHFGTSPAELVGRSVLTLAHPDDVARAEEALAQLARGRTEASLTVRTLDADGRARTLEWHVTVDPEARLLYGVGVDRTAEIAARAERDAEARRLEGVIAGTRVGTWEWNVQTGETRFNERWAEIIGYTLAELAPVSIETWLAAAHPDDLADSEAALAAHFRGDADFYEVECRMRHRDGHWVWVLDRGQVHTWTDAGEPEWMFGTHADITPRKEMEFELRHSHSMLQQAEHIAGIGTWRLDAATGELTWSDEMYRILGLRPGEVEPDREHFNARVHPEDREAVDAAFLASMADGSGGYEGDIRIRRADTGELRHVHVQNRHVRTPNGGLVRSMGTLNDVTDRVLKERELERRTQEFRSLADNMRDIVVRLDPRGRHLFANRAALRRSGHALDEVVGRTGAEIGLPPALARLLDRITEQVAGSGDTVEGTVGDVFDTTFSYQAIPESDGDGATASVLVIFRDVSDLLRREEERREMERRLLQAQKLESLGVMAGGIAHDFNNILAALLGHTELLREEVGEDEELDLHLEGLLQGIDRAAGLTGQMLDFSGGTAAEFDHLDLAEVVAGIGSLLRSSVPHTIDLEIAPPEAPLHVLGSADQLRQMVVNLVTNGADAIGEAGGSIAVHVTRVAPPDLPLSRDAMDLATPDFDPAGPMACIEVRDDGPGMSERVRTRIFEPFFTTRFQGRGLGMAAVQGIVHAHRAGLQICSAPGEGAAVRVYLPLADPDDAAPGEAAGSAPAGSGSRLRILVVDDEAPVRTMLETVFRRDGHAVGTAEDGREALAWLGDHEADVVFLDLTMPHMGGTECLEGLRALHPDLPVVMMSGYSAERLGEVAASDDVELLKKPFSLAAVRAALAEVFTARE